MAATPAPAASPSLAAFWRSVDPDGETDAVANRPGDDATTTLIVPGLWNSGPDHWQSLWCDEDASCRRVDLGDWDAPSRALWISRLDRAVARERRPVVLAAHSLGCLAVAWWAAEASAARLHKVAAALLVAPPDVDAARAHPLVRGFAPTPRARLPFPALLVASRDDRHATFERLAELASDWEAILVDAGRRGHINADSGLGDWPEGKTLLRAIRTPRPPDAADLAAATGYAVHARADGRHPPATKRE